jgi:ERCC4-type nuclease
MLLQIDNREQDLITQINALIGYVPLFKDIKVEVTQLPLGDIIMHDNELNKSLLVIERKSINDLVASIKDGRYEEQSYRLNGLNHHNHNIIYLIEGDMNRANHFKDTKIEKLTVCSAIFSLNYYKGFSVIRTLNLEETATFLCNTFVKLNKERTNKKAYYDVVNDAVVRDTSTEASCDKEYVSVIKKVKKDNITNENIGEIMLCQIPGISSVSALAIMNKFKTFNNLMKELETNSNCLDDITTVTKTGQNRKISGKIVENVKKFLIS